MGREVDTRATVITTPRLARGIMQIGVVMYYATLLLLILLSKGFTGLTVQERAMDINRQAAWSLFRQQKPIELP